MKKITITCSNKPCDEAIRNFHRLRCRILVAQHGVEFAKSLLEELKKQ